MRIDSKWLPISVKSRVQKFAHDNPWLIGMLLSRQGKITLISISALLIIILGNSYLYQPPQDHVRKLKKRMEKTAEKISEMRAAFPDISKDQVLLATKDNLVENIRVRLKAEEEKLPRRDELSQVLDQLMTPGDHGAFTVVSIKPREEKTAKKTKEEKAEIQFYPVENFDIELAAGFWDLVAYLSRLEQVSSFFSFPGLQMKTNAKKPGEPPRILLQVATIFGERTNDASRTDTIFQTDVEPFRPEHSERDPFGSLSKADEGIAKSERFKVSGVLWKGGRKVVIINSKVLREGDMLDSVQVISISDSSVVLSEQGRQFELGLK